MIIIAESGSTKTDWVGLKGKIVGLEIETIGLNPFYVTKEKVKSEFENKIKPHLTEKITEVHFYGTGITDAEKANVISEAIKEALAYETTVNTYSDVVAAAKSLFGDQEGIACILGTGSNSCFWSGSEIKFQIPPLGFWLGDEGSGGNLGKQLILSYLHKDLPSELTLKFTIKYGNLDRLDILAMAYKNEFPNKYFAAFSTFIKDNLEHPFMKNLVKKAFEDFFNLYLLKYPTIKNHPIGFVGSIAKHYSSILEEVAFSNHLQIAQINAKPIEKLVDYHKNHN